MLLSGSWLTCLCGKASLFVALMTYNTAEGVRMQTSCLLEEAFITQHQGWGTLRGVWEKELHQYSVDRGIWGILLHGLLRLDVSLYRVNRKILAP